MNDTPEPELSYCGIECKECLAYLAKVTGNKELQEKASKVWSTNEFEVDPVDVHCDGCRTDTGDLFKHCVICAVRECAMENNFANCAYCNDYPCDKLENLWNMLNAPDAKDRLDEICNTLTGLARGQISRYR